MLTLSNIKLPEFIRWGCVGVVATGIHYGIYYLLKEYLFPNTTFWVNFAYSAGYVISFLCNFFLSAYFTFHEKPSFRKGAGFSVAHLANYGLHILFLNFFMWAVIVFFVAAEGFLSKQRQKSIIKISEQEAKKEA